MEKFDAMNKDMFDEYVDGDSDGSATLEEIEMVIINFHSKRVENYHKICFLGEMVEKSFKYTF